eukprot:7886816-Alexandrium_andersonii.AAC.1
MSASLVGSEMCIRDRRNAAWEVITGHRACSHARAAAARVRLKVARSWAVSYTHLTLPTICSV